MGHCFHKLDCGHGSVIATYGAEEMPLPEINEE
jgi:hypothetical protein